MTRNICRTHATPTFFCTYVFAAASFCKNDWIRLQLTVPLPFFFFAVGVIPREQGGLVWLTAEDVKICGVHCTTLFASKMPAPTSKRIKSIRNSAMRGACRSIIKSVARSFFSSSILRWESRKNCVKGLPRLGRFTGCSATWPLTPLLVPLLKGSKTNSRYGSETLTH